MYYPLNSKNPRQIFFELSHPAFQRLQARARRHRICSLATQAFLNYQQVTLVVCQVLGGIRSRNIPNVE